MFVDNLTANLPAMASGQSQKDDLRFRKYCNVILRM